MVDTFIRVNNVDVPYVYSERRAGDLPVLYSDASKAKEEIGWVAKKSLEDMCRDAWNFVLKNNWDFKRKEKNERDFNSC